MGIGSRDHAIWGAGVKLERGRGVIYGPVAAELLGWICVVEELGWLVRENVRSVESRVILPGVVLGRWEVRRGEACSLQCGGWVIEG